MPIHHASIVPVIDNGLVDGRLFLVMQYVAGVTLQHWLDGTPMPSFSDNIKPDEAWDLVFYLRTLQPKNEYNAKEKQIAKELNLKPVSQQ